MSRTQIIDGPLDGVLAGALVGLLAMAAVACSSSATPPAPAAATTAPAPGRLALGYRPATAPDAAIAKAQAAALRAPGPTTHLALANAFIARARYGRDPALLLYADDALTAARAGGAAIAELAVPTIYLLSEQHRFAEARDAARGLIAAAPSEPTGHLLLGDALLELGDYDAAAESYQRAIDLRPELRSYERAAHVRWLDGDVDGALELLDRALESASPRDPEPAAWCHVQRGTLRWQRGQQGEAGADAARAHALVPGYPAAQLLAARVRAARGDLAGALAAVDAIPVRVRTAEELALRAELLERLGLDAGAAIADLAQRRRSDPREVARFWARRGVATDDAHRLAAEVARERPTIEAFAVAALAEARAGDVDAARRDITRARRLGTPDPRLPLYAAVVELAAGDREAARRLAAEASPAAQAVDPLLVAEIERRLLTGAP